MNVLEKLKSRGHWHTVIRPTLFRKKRVQNIAALKPILDKSFVQFRGWDFPHIDIQHEIRTGDDWIDQAIDWEHYVEFWRFFQSGQFVSLSGMPSDWRDQSGFWRPSPHENWKPGQHLDVVHAIFRYTEIFEFAARLSLSEAGDDAMHIAVRLEQLAGRELWIQSGFRTPFFHSHKAGIPNYQQVISLSKAELSADPRKYAVQFAAELFKRFNWDPPINLLQSIQADLRNNRGN